MADFINLTCNTTRISYFSPINKIYDDDKLLAANASSPQSYYVKYSTLTSYILTAGIEKVETGFAPQGEWNFANTNSMIYISVDNIEKETAVPNLKYINENLLTALTALSAQLYSDNQHLPSYVGQIILGDNLASHAAVTRIYGTDTVWKKIEGRFLFGSGANESNTIADYGKIDKGAVNVGVKKLGGECKTSLIGLPKHSHAFAGVNFGKVPEREISPFDLEKEGEGKKIWDAGTTGPSKGHNHGGKKRFFIAYGTKHEASEYISLIEETYNFKFAGEISDNDRNNSMVNAPHENIPPFRCTHIWERIK